MNLEFSDEEKKITPLSRHDPLFSLTSRDDQPGGDPPAGSVLPHAVSRGLPRAALWPHDELLEGEARGEAHLRAPPAHPQRLLHRHGGTLRDAALMKKTSSVFIFIR